MNEPTRPYEVVVDKLVAQIQQLSGANLLRYHRLGKVVSEFISALGSGRYGRGASMQQLADDLVGRGVLLDVLHPTRVLYYTAALFNMHPVEEDLTALADNGYTMSHARLVMSVSVDEAVQADFMKRARNDQGRFKSVRQLLDMLKPEQAVVAMAEVIEDDPSALTTPPATPSTDIPVVPAGKVIKAKGAKATPDMVPPETAADTVVTPDTPALPTPVASGEHKAGAEKQYTYAVGKTLDATQKLLDKLMAQLPDAVITIREIGQIGSNKPSTLKAYHDKMREIRQAAFNAVEHLRAVEELIDGELRSHTGG